MRVHRPRLSGLLANAIRHEPITITIPSFDGAACAGHPDPDLWFAHEVSQAVEVKVALNICNDCPAKNACLAYALTEDIEYGIWGGVAASERQKEKRKKAWEARQAKFTGARRRSA